MRDQESGTVSHRIPELDGVRAMAIILVLFWHYVLCQLPAPAIAKLGATYSMLAATRTGVDLFFVLSGFLIGGVILENRNAENFFQVFYFRRACRIFPIYLVMLTLFAGMSALGLKYSAWLFGCPEAHIQVTCSAMVPPIYSYMLFVQNFFMGSQGSFGPHWLAITWSLAIEEQFYLVVPLLMVLVPGRSLLFVLGGLIIAAPLARAYSGDFAAYVLSYCRADALLAGVVAAIVQRSELWLRARRPKRMAIAVSMGLISIGCALLLWYVADARRIWTHSFFAALYFALLLLVLAFRSHGALSILRGSGLRWVGERSYGIYMFHQAVAGTFHALLFSGAAPEINSGATLFTTGASLVATLLVADQSYKHFELYFLRLGHRLPFQSEIAKAGA